MKCEPTVLGCRQGSGGKPSLYPESDSGEGPSFGAVVLQERVGLLHTQEEGTLENNMPSTAQTMMIFTPSKIELEKGQAVDHLIIRIGRACHTG